GAVITVNLRSRKVLNSDGTVAYFEAMLEDITQKKISEELIWKQANFDPLTRLPNRQMLNDRLREEIKKAHCACQCLAVLFIDLDHFKEVNDTLGHQLGDTLLMEAASRIVACVREIDTVARTGGDEFTIILSGLNDSKNADKVSARIAEKILDAVAEPFHLSFETLYISASIGITYYPDDAERIEDLLRHADQAMYVAKKEGRNRYHYFTTALQQSNRARRRLSNDLRIALAKRQFEVYFQPIVELATGKVVKAEALLRWNTPSHRSISPSEFIPVAEDMGLIVEIGEWVFKEVAERTKKWRRMCPKGFQASVNVSPLQFLETTKHCHDWPSYLASNGVDGESIVVEITEGMLLNVEKRSTNPLLFKFRDAGIQVAIDDFGTGYSALSYLKKFHIDYLKIDQSFVRNLNTDLADRVLVEAITAMAHKLGLKVIAEGVETERQKHLLAEAGCDFVQGHLYYPALPSSAFERLLVMQCESTE
ncbi:MAG: putative bifunctional diguanylate cyclase/phosphodiesterase, partial [Gammaproteobacteria bacterium]